MLTMESRKFSICPSKLKKEEGNLRCPVKLETINSTPQVTLRTMNTPINGGSQDSIRPETFRSFKPNGAIVYQ